jgi:hypothetical protein
VLVRRERKNLLTGNVLAKKCGRIQELVMILSFIAFLPVCDLNAG